MSFDILFYYDRRSPTTHARKAAGLSRVMPQSGSAFAEGERERRQSRANSEVRGCQFTGDESRRAIRKKAPPFRPVIAAMSWAASGIAEGIVAYGMAIHPAEYFEAFDAARDHDDPASAQHTGADNVHVTFFSYARSTRPDDLAGGPTQALRVTVNPPAPEDPRQSMPVTGVPHGWGLWVFSQLAEFASRLHRWWKVKQTITYVGDLNDRTLRDIGVSRYEIMHPAKHQHRL